MTAIRRFSQTDALEKSLVHVGHALRRQTFYTGVLTILSGVLLGLLCGFVLDYLTRFPYPLRLLLLLGGMGYGGWWFHRKIWRALQTPVRAEEVGLKVEAATPELQSRLISTLQFQAPKATIGRGTSLNLVEGLCTQTFGMTKGLDLRRLIQRPWARRQLPRCAAAILVLGLCGLLAPAYFQAFLLRLVLPGAAYPTRTKIVRVELPEKLPAGDAFHLRVHAEGVLPELGKVEVVPQEGDAAELDLMREGAKKGQYICAMTPITAPAQITVMLGDAVRGPLTVTPVPRPYLKSIRVTIKAPAYTVHGDAKATRVENTGNVRVVEGSELELDVEATKPLTSIALQAESDRVKLPALKKIKGEHYTATLKATTSFGFTLTMEDTEGLVAKDLPVYRVSVVRDRPPRVRIRRPRSATEAAPVSRIPLTFSVKDDFQIGSIRILYQRLKAESLEEMAAGMPDEEDARVYMEINADGKAEYEFADFWENRKINPLPGETIRFWVEATDTAQPQPHMSRSSEVMIRVVSAAEYRLLLLQRLGDQKEYIEDRILDLKDSRRQIDRLRDGK